MKLSRLTVLLIIATLISSYTVASASPVILPTVTILPPPIQLPTPIISPTVTKTETDPTITIPKPTITIIPIPTVPIKPTIITFKKLIHEVIVKVDPPYAGEVKPLAPGKHLLKDGSRVLLRAIPNAGYQFDHWTVDDRTIRSRILRLQVQKDHVVVAHFTKASGRNESSPRIPTGSQPQSTTPVGYALPSDFPSSMSYSGMYADLLYNEDLLANFGGGAGGSVVIGRKAVQPQPWQRYGVKMDALSLWVNGTKYTASFGSEDYGVIYLTCEDGHLTIRTAGLTRYGTRAALLYLLNNPEDVDGKVLIVLGWKDTNSDGKVELGEIFLLWSLP